MYIPVHLYGIARCLAPPAQRIQQGLEAGVNCTRRVAGVEAGVTCTCTDG